jgi:hypothetical protein
MSTSRRGGTSARAGRSQGSKSAVAHANARLTHDEAHTRGVGGGEAAAKRAARRALR